MTFSILSFLNQKNNYHDETTFMSNRIIIKLCDYKKVLLLFLVTFVITNEVYKILLWGKIGRAHV